MATFEILFATLVTRQSVAGSATGHVTFLLVLAFPGALFTTGCAGFITRLMAPRVSACDLALVRARRTEGVLVACSTTGMTTKVTLAALGLTLAMNSSGDLDRWSIITLLFGA